MKLLTSAVVLLSAVATCAFAPATPLAFAPRSSSSLNMVADDAKVILVTGSSRGLGKSIALDLGQKGQKVVINYVSDSSKESADATVAEIKAAGGDAIAVQADSTCPNTFSSVLCLFAFIHISHVLFFTSTQIGSKPDAINKMFDEIVEAYGTCDVLINNAGITKDTLVLRMKPDMWQSVIDINLSGVFYCTQAFFKIASKKRTGRIINISSVVGQIGNPGQANYAAAKGGVIGLTMSNAKEFASRGVTVNCVCPGFIATDMTAKLDDAYLEKVSEGIPLKRLGKPEEVAGMTTFLALDPAADYITGHCFNVDGGIAMGA
jgi:3-oxoacyl-[acyl-carrier protein] reductase